MKHTEPGSKTQNFTDATLRAALEKIVVTVGVGRLSGQANFKDKVMPQIERDLALIVGQKAAPRVARKSIAGFKVREGQIVGLMITLRGRKMIDFFKRLTMIVLPRVRDFRGLALSSIDDGGVLNVGIKEHVVFPEIDPEQSPLIFSLGASIVPRIHDRDGATELYRRLGVPLKKQ